MEGSSTNYWVFLDAFEPQLWLAIIGTCIVVGAVVWAAERWAWVGRPPRGGPAPPNLQTRVWTALGRPMQVEAACCHCRQQKQGCLREAAALLHVPSSAACPLRADHRHEGQQLCWQPDVRGWWGGQRALWAGTHALGWLWGACCGCRQPLFLHASSTWLPCNAIFPSNSVLVFAFMALILVTLFTANTGKRAAVLGTWRCMRPAPALGGGMSCPSCHAPPHLQPPT